MFQAPQRPGTDKDIPSTSVCGLVPTMGRSTANATKGNSIARRRPKTANGMRATVESPTRSAAYAPNAQKASRGVATTTNTNAMVATSLHSGASRVDRRRAVDEQWTVLPGAHGQPDAVIGDEDARREPAERRRATNQRPPNRRAAIRRVIATPAIPERPLLTFSFFTSLTAYPASGPSATALAFAFVVEALVDRDLVEAVGR